MTEPRDPELPKEPAPEEPAHEHHSIVEELREEIHDVVEEVVEHVPPPVRWTVRRIVGLVFLILVALVVVTAVSVGLWLANRTEWVAQEIALLVNQALATRSDVELVMKDLRGNPFTGVRVVHPMVRFRDGNDPPVLEARELTLRYSALGILTRSNKQIDIEVTEPVIQLPVGADGKTRVPIWKSSGKTGTRPRAFHFGVMVHRATVRMPALKPGIEGLDLKARVQLGFGTLVNLDHLSWTKGPWDNPLQELRGTIEAGDSVHVRIEELRSPALVLRGQAHKKSGQRAAAVDATVERVRWTWLAKVFDNGVFDVPGEGRFVVHGVADSVTQGSFTTKLDWNGLTAEGKGDVRWVGPRVDVAPLEATTSAGTIAGRFEMIGKRWVLVGDVGHSDPRAWKSFHLDGWPEGDLSGLLEMGQNERKDLTLTARLGASMMAGWRADSARVRFLAPAATTDTFIVDYLRRGGEMRLLAGTRSWGWAGQWEARDLPLDEWPDGRKSGLTGRLVAGRGTVTSRDGALLVDGDLDGNSADWLGGHYARWKLAGVSGRLLPTPDLHATAHLADLMFLGLHFDSSRVDFQLADRAVALRAVDAWASDTLVSVGGDATWNEAGWTLALARAEMTSRQFHWTAEPPMQLAGDVHGVDFVRFVANDSLAHVDARGRWAAPGGEYTFDADARNLDLGRLGLPLEWELGGRSDAVLSVRGPNGDPRWTLTSRSRTPGMQGHAADSLDLDLAGSQHRVEIRSGTLRVAGGRATFQGKVEGTGRAWPDTLTGPGIVRWLADAARWEGQLNADKVSLLTLDRVMPQPIGWSGTVDGRLDLGGRPAQPVFTSEARIRPFGWRDFSVDEVTLKARFGDDRLTVEDLKLTRGAVSSSIRGNLPLALALGAKAGVPDAPMDWTAAIADGDLALLPSFVPQIGWARGKFDLRTTVGGTTRHPQLTGTMNVREGALRMAGREEVLDRLSADFHFNQSRITLDTLTARQGSQGTVNAHGAVDLEGMALRGYRFDLALRQFTATEAGLYAASFDGDFIVTNGRRIHGATLPQVTGQVNLRSAAVLFDFANQSETQQLAATTQPLFWTYRVQVNATRNLHWQPPDGDIEFSADLLVEQTADSLLIYGDLTSLRGTYYFLSNRFTVARADLTFDNESGVNPNLDIEASARVIPTSEPSGPLQGSSSTSSRTHTVTARITGRADEPVVELVSDPSDWDEPQILRELTVGRFYDPQRGGVQLGDPLDNYLTRAINRTVSAEVSRAFNGYINEWALERERGGLLQGAGDLVLGVGSQITPNISVRYRQRLPGLGRQGILPGDIDTGFERDVEAEYRLNRFFYVTTELTQRKNLGGTTTSTVGGPDFNVNLKARWEY